MKRQYQPVNLEDLPICEYNLKDTINQEADEWLSSDLITDPEFWNALEIVVNTRRKNFRREKN